MLHSSRLKNNANWVAYALDLFHVDTLPDTLSKHPVDEANIMKFCKLFMRFRRWLLIADFKASLDEFLEDMRSVVKDAILDEVKLTIIMILLKYVIKVVWALVL